jgi:hypothetical protein
VSIRRTAVLAMLVATLAGILASAGRAGADDPAPLPPDQAQALATAPDTGGSTTTAVDGLTALNASAQPDSDTSIEAGVSPQAAVGLAPLTESALISSAKPSCWANAAWHQWGTWPYQQRITDTTYWCAVYGSHITYRSSTTTTNGTLCATNWRAHQLISGGVGRGFTYFTNRSSAGFACPTIIPWITLHTTHHQDVKRNDRGVASFVGTG